MPLINVFSSPVFGTGHRTSNFPPYKNRYTVSVQSNLSFTVTRLHPTPKSSSKRGDRRARQNKNSGTRGAVRELAANSHLTSAANVVTFKGDINQRPPNWLLTQSPPRNFVNQIYWIQQSYSGTFTVPVSTVFLEQNYAFHLNNFPQGATLTGIFDQYCFYAVTMSFTPRNAASGFNEFGQFVTAIDYDNVTALGSFGAIQDFSNSLTVELESGQSVQRIVKPTLAPQVYSFSASTTGYSTGRMWVDSASTSVEHYGIRTGYQDNGISNVSFGIDYTITALLGFRNVH